MCTVTELPSACSLCLVKPHVLKENKVGELLSVILDNKFRIQGMLAVHLSVDMAESFLDVYKVTNAVYL